ncbi:hypothetical protein AnigIFM60653_002361 [Aspergillus niger]|nr:hypothetical protein AnigIFM60653_002361 [Aspergillus niger]
MVRKITFPCAEVVETMVDTHAVFHATSTEKEVLCCHTWEDTSQPSMHAVGEEDTVRERPFKDVLTKPRSRSTPEIQKIFPKQVAKADGFLKTTTQNLLTRCFNINIRVDHKVHPKGDKGADFVAEPGPKFEPEEPTRVVEVAVAPSPSVEEVEAPFAANPRDMPVPRTMRTMGEYGDQFLILPGSLIFGEPAKQDRPFYTSSTIVPATTRVLLSSSTTQGLITPTERASSFEYLAPAPFPDASTAEQRPVAVPAAIRQPI